MAQPSFRGPAPAEAVLGPRLKDIGHFHVCAEFKERNCNPWQWDVRRKQLNGKANPRVKLFVLARASALTHPLGRFLLDLRESDALLIPGIDSLHCFSADFSLSMDLAG